MMTQTRQITALTFAALLAACSVLPALAKKPPKPVVPAQRFDRAQFMLINLNRGPGSTGGYIAESRKRTVQTMTELQKALHQLQQVENTYVKSRGRPDDHILPGSAVRIKAAQKTAEQLLSQLQDAERELKSEIQQTMILEH